MTVTLRDYEDVVGPEVIEEIRMVAGYVRHKSLQNINSTSVGGGVAEILTRMIPLLRELGVNASWDVIKGNEAFYQRDESLSTMRFMEIRKRSRRRCWISIVKILR